MAALKQRGLSIHFPITSTTRPRRPGEKEGVDYHFLSPEEFEKLKKAGSLAEWAQVYGYYYGVPKKAFEQALSHDQDVILKVDVQGAATLKRLYPQSILLFVAPPSPQELERRLRGRGTEPAQLKRRLETAAQEMAKLTLFDYQVVNENLEEAVNQIEAIITAERCRVNKE